MTPQDKNILKLLEYLKTEGDFNNVFNVIPELKDKDKIKEYFLKIFDVYSQQISFPS